VSYFIFNFFQIILLATRHQSVAHYGGRDQEDCSSKSAWANSSQDPISKNPSQKRAGGVAQSLGPEFKPQYCKKRKKRKEKFLDSSIE
jgi:hypothetical protein